MPCASHTKAAENHEKGDHKAALAKSTDAKCCCGTAQKATDDAHEKSAMQAKS